MPTIRELLNELQDLPTAQDVAERLEAAGIRGIPGLPRACPVARYLSTGSDCLYGLSVGRTTVLIGSENEHLSAAVLSFGGSSVADFITLFDMGSFTDLIERIVY